MDIDRVFRIATSAERHLMRLERQGCSAPAAYRELVAFVAAKHPSPVWKKAATLPLDDDLDRLTTWLRGVFKNEAPERRVNGLWFGLFEDAKAGFTLYVAGSRRYTRKLSIQWAVGPEWWPDRRYSKSSVLQSLTKLRPRNEDVMYLVETCLVFGYAAIAVCEMLRRIDPAMLLGAAPKRGVGCGFDSGDLGQLGQVTPRGFSVYPG